MKAEELLKNHPLSREVIRKWYFEKMTNSLEMVNDIDEEFRQVIMNEALTDERLSVLIDSQPRALFDLFDENNIIIQTLLHPNKIFTCIIGEKDPSQVFSKTRKESESSAIEKAFKLLEDKLTQLEFPKLIKDENS